MKILIRNAYNTYNYGTMMMCENIINELNKRINSITYFIDNATEDNLMRLKEATEYNEIYSANLYKEKYNQKDGLIAKIIRKLRYELHSFQVSISSKKYDAILVLGGDDFAETYSSKKYALKALKSLKQLSKRSKVIMLGQTIGPYTGKRKKYASELLKRIKVYTRDVISSKYIKEELGVETSISRDLALMDLNLQEKYNADYMKILKKYNISDNNYIVIVGTGLAKWYCDDNKKFYSKFIEIINEIKLKYKDKDIVWLSHVTTDEPELSDNTMLNYINSEYGNFANSNMIVINKKMLPVEARIILGHSYFTLTCRMHAAVSTFQMGKPAICLSYSTKYKGVIAEGLNMEKLVIEAKDEKKWDGEIINIINNEINYIDSTYKELTDKIKINVDSCKKIIRKTLDEVAEIIKTD